MRILNNNISAKSVIVPAPRFYTVKQAAIVLNVSEKSVRRLIERGILRTSPALRKKLIPCEDVDNFFDNTK